MPPVVITLSVDCMGGDHGPAVTLPACREFLDVHPDARLLLVGLPDALAGFAHPRASILPASDPAADAWLVTSPPYFVGNLIEFGAQVYNGGPNASGPIEVVFETQNLEIEEIQSPSCGATPCVLLPLGVGIENGETFSITARITAPGTFYLRTRAVSASYDVIPGNSSRIVLGTASVHPANTGLFRDGFE